MQEFEVIEVLPELIARLEENEALINLTQGQIAQFAERAKARLVAQGETIIRQDDDNKDFFVIIRGDFKVYHTDEGKDSLLNILHASDIVGLRAILGGGKRSATVQAQQDSVVAVYDENDWRWLLQQDPTIETYFRQLEHRYDDRSLKDFPGRQSDEVVVIAVKRHVIALIARLVVPVFILLIPVLFLTFTELLGLGFINNLLDRMSLLCLGPFILLALLSALYQYVDWRNDDLIVTTKRVLHIERILFYGEERREAPLTQIQNVTIEAHNWFYILLGVDDIQIHTAALGVLRVNTIKSAQSLSNIILREQQYAKERASALDVGAVRNTLRDRLDRHILAPTDVSVAPLVIKRKKPSLIPKLPKVSLGYYVPKIKEAAPDGSKITWRKHYVVLIARVGLSLLASTGILLVLVAAFFGLWPFSSPAEWWLIFLLLVALGVCLFWYTARYDSWRRDVYIVTKEKIIDVESSAFRLRGESSREGSFDSVQSITYNIPGFIAKILNMGDLVIETASVVGRFTFIKVYNPSAVQEEIFDRWDAYQNQKQRKSRDEANKQVVEILGEYHEMTKK